METTSDAYPNAGRSVGLFGLGCFQLSGAQKCSQMPSKTDGKQMISPTAYSIKILRSIITASILAQALLWAQNVQFSGSVTLSG